MILGSHHEDDSLNIHFFHINETGQFGRDAASEEVVAEFQCVQKLQLPNLFWDTASEPVIPDFQFPRQVKQAIVLETIE